MIISNYVYHVTRKSKLSSIIKRGIIPNIPTDWEDWSQPKAVYLFNSKAAAKEGAIVWIYPRYKKGTKLVILTISSKGINIFPSDPEDKGGWELISLSTIPPKNIIKIEDV